METGIASLTSLDPGKQWVITLQDHVSVLIQTYVRVVFTSSICETSTTFWNCGIKRLWTLCCVSLLTSREFSYLVLYWYILADFPRKLQKKTEKNGPGGGVRMVPPPPPGSTNSMDSFVLYWFILFFTCSKHKIHLRYVHAAEILAENVLHFPSCFIHYIYPSYCYLVL